MCPAVNILYVLSGQFKGDGANQELNYILIFVYKKVEILLWNWHVKNDTKI